MSASIRPPGGPAGAGAVDGTAEISPSGAAGIDEATASSAVAPAAAGEVHSPSAAILNRLDAGEITREQAIDGMVAEALSTLGAGRLPPTQRAELENVLRAALADDPTLSKLLG